MLHAYRIIALLFSISLQHLHCAKEQWKAMQEACIQGYNDWTGSVSSIEQCRDLCLRTLSFGCVSIDYYNGTCNLSRKRRTDVPPTSFEQPCAPGWKYVERIVAPEEGLWTKPRNACMQHHNDLVTKTASVAACILRCELEPNCCSVEFHEGLLCHLSAYTQNTLRLKSAFTEPCYAKGWLYAERFDKKCIIT